MSDWLNHALALGRADDCIALTAVFTAALQQQFDVTNARVFHPCAEGRHLEMAGDGDNNTGWLVHDFTHPLAHVLRSGERMLLDSQQLLYWQDHPAFVALQRQMSPGDGVLIWPLAATDGAALVGLLVLNGAPLILKTLSHNDECLCFCQLFCHHWLRLVALGQHRRHQDELQASLTRMHQQAVQRQHHDALKTQLIGDSPVMAQLRQSIVVAASSRLSVLICGATGTGKERIAQGIHQQSARSARPLVAINCAAIPETLLESELFGHVRGAFTGALNRRQGLLAQADGGTLFLDEIGDLSQPLQAKLLRVLENRCYRPLGGERELEVDFRLIAATHVPLQQRIQQGLFRQDLYYRLNQYPIHAPALGDRLMDIPALARHFIDIYNQQHGTTVAGISTAALDYLYRHDFAGHVRELRNLVEYACAFTGDDQLITPYPLTERLSAAIAEPSASDPMSPYHNIGDLKGAVTHFEREVIRSRLALFGGNRQRAAFSLGLPKRTLADKCLKLEITAP